jgi:lipoprotein-releasing system permease protein
MATAAARPTRAFAAFEWMLASRYLRTRRREGFVSVIAGFSFIGIMLGVATLIIVLSVMNGFRKELLDKIVGINGHIFIAPIEKPLTDYAELSSRIAKVAGVRRAIPMVEGPGLRLLAVQRSRACSCRGVRGEDMPKIDACREHRQGTWRTSTSGASHRPASRRIPWRSSGRHITLRHAAGASTPFGNARGSRLSRHGVFEIGMSEFDATFVYMPLARRRPISTGGCEAIEVFPRQCRPGGRGRARPSRAAASGRS